jgi:hypothetical protein
LPSEIGPSLISLHFLFEFRACWDILKVRLRCE